MSAFSPLTTWLESSSPSMLWGEIHGGGLGDGGRSSGWDWLFGPILNDADAVIKLQIQGSSLHFPGDLSKGNASISLDIRGRLSNSWNGYSKISTWIEDTPNFLNGVVHGGGLGDGGRSCYLDWVFGSRLNDGEINLTINVLGAALRTGSLGTGNSLTTIKMEGYLRIKNEGQFPIVTWLENAQATRLLPMFHGGGLGDGGYYCWNQWVFGNPPFMESVCDISITSSGTLHKGLTTNANTTFSVSLYGDLLAGMSSAIWDTEFRHSTVTLSDNYLSATAPKETYRGVRCKKSHTTGKYYFEFTRKTVPDSEYPIVGLAKSTANNQNDVWLSDTWFWIDYWLFENGVNQITWGRYITNGINAIAVDLDAGKIWFYSETGSEWHNGGNPAAGTNPSFTNVFGTVYPIFNSGFGSTYPSAVTANFGATPFTHTIPSGFSAWNITEPLLCDCFITITTNGTLTIDRTLLGLASSNISFELLSTLTYTLSFVFSGNIEILFNAEGTLETPRTFIDANPIDIFINLNSTLTQQTETILTIPLTLTLQGQLGNTFIAFKLHEVFYEADIQIRNLHETFYGTLSTRNHFTSYYGLTEIFNQHNIFWTFASSKLHEIQYTTIVKQRTTQLHEVAWASLGGATSASALHEVIWASVGSGAASSWILHETEWSSSVRVSNLALHEVSWASLGGSSSTWGWHEVTWASVGSSVGGSAFAFHATSWESQADNSVKLHTISWKSIIENRRFHTTSWATDYNNYLLHTSRYRSTQTTPTLVIGDFYVRLGNSNLDFLSVYISSDEDSPYFQGEITLKDSKDYQRFPRDTPFIVHLLDLDFHFIVDSRKLSRTIDDEGNLLESCTISGLSPLVAFSSPRSMNITKTWNDPTLASVIVEELLGPVTWNLIDWVIPAFRLAADNASPLDIATQVVTAVGGLIESQPDGSIVCRHRWPTSITQFETSLPLDVWDETTIFSSSESSTNDELINKIRILDAEASYQDRLEYVPNKSGNDTDGMNGVLYAFISPWREGIRIVTTRPSVIRVGTLYEGVRIIADTNPEYPAETLTFTEGESSTEYPVLQLTELTWLDENLGSAAVAPYSTAITAGSGTYGGYSLAKASYTARYLAVPVSCFASQVPTEAQFLLLETVNE